MKTGNPDYQNNWWFGFSAFQNYIFCRVLDIRVPEHVEVHQFLKDMEDRGYTFYIGKGDYAKQGMIQIANMGEIYEQDCRNMLEVFGLVLNQD